MFNFSNPTPFGATSTPAKPFGVASTTANTGFSAAPPFGQTSTFGATSFAAPTASVAPSFGGFGTAPTQAVAAQPAGLGSFGQAPAPAAGGFGLGSSFGGAAQAPTTSAPAFGGFGTGLGFGAPAATTTTAFSFNTPSFATNTTQSLFSGFGSNFGKPTATTSAFGSFGQPLGQQTLGQPLMGGQQQFQQQQQQALSPDEAFAQSIFNVSIFDDERDTVIARWNYLQAMWGSGKSFYAKNMPPVDITPQNYLCRFKAIGYIKIPGKDNKVGHILLTVNKPEADVNNQKDQLIAQLHQIFGNKPNIIVNIDKVEPLSDTKSQVVIYIQEKSQISNELKRIPSTEICNFLNQPMTKPQINNVGIESAVAPITPDEDQLKEYLEKPPKGIDARMWNQAKQDNPDPKKFIPMPIVGFGELKRRIKCQEKETGIHLMYLAKVQKELDELKQKHIDATAKILGHKRKLADLCHIILHIIVKQEITRKVGVALSPDEEILRSKLENMQAIVSAPTQYKGRLSELLSHMRIQRNQWNLANTVDYALDPDAAEEMKTILSMHQKAMSVLIETANKDMEILSNIYSKMAEIVRE